MDCQFISIFGKFVASQTASFSRADINGLLKYNLFWFQRARNICIFQENVLLQGILNIIQGFRQNKLNKWTLFNVLNVIMSVFKYLLRILALAIALHAEEFVLFCRLITFCNNQLKYSFVSWLLNVSPHNKPGTH